MKPTHILIIFFSFTSILNASYSLEPQAKDSLITFLKQLSNDTTRFGTLWNSSSDPCLNKWKGVVCNAQNAVKSINVTGFNLSGTFDAAPLCNDPSLSSSLSHLILDGNNIHGRISSDIANCRKLTRLQMSRNSFTETISDSLSKLSNLKALDISYNKFSGHLPNMSRISGLTVLLAQYNHLTGNLAPLDFHNLHQFNLSYNDFIGPAPDTDGLFPGCYVGNPRLCGDQLPNKCLPCMSDSSESQKPHKSNAKKIVMYSGYALLCLVVVSFFYRLLKRVKKTEAVNKVAASSDDTARNTGALSTEVFSMVSGDKSGPLSASLVVMSSPEGNNLKFEDLLRAPAELLGRGQHGSLYKVMLENGMVLVVKRIKDWWISSSEFRLRMQRLDRAKHPKVSPPLAHYSSQHEKLLVYEYQDNGSLLRLLQDAQKGQEFEWSSRLGTAAGIAEALAYMHNELNNTTISHGNLKSSNILFNKNMEPILSEYGLKASQNTTTKASSSSTTSPRPFKADIYAFGVILLELLTGKLMGKEDEEEDLTKWVQSVVREEWTAEVFDKSLIASGASEERMVSLLRIAVKCVNPDADSRPSMKQVVVMVNTLKEEEDRSLMSEV